MRILSIFKIAGLLVIAIIVAAVAIVVAVDPNQFKGELQDAVRDSTGRDLVIDGSIGLSLGLTAGLSIGNVRFSNAEWGTAPDLLRAKEVVVQVAVLPLFAERVVIRGLVIRDAQIQIERDAKGRSNLDMRATEPAAAPASGFTQDDDRDDISFNISRATVENSTLTMRDAARKSEDVLVAESLELTPDHARSLLEIDLEGTLSTGGQPLPLKVTGTIGFIETLIADNLPYPLDIRGEAFDTAFVVKGEIGNVAKLTGLALDVDVSGPDLAPISRFTGVDLPPNLAFTAAGKVSGGGDRYAVAGLKLALGNTDAGGDIAISLAGVRPRIEGTIRATRIDLTELDLPPAAGAPKTTAATAPGASGDKPSERAFSDTGLPLDVLKAFDANLAISIAELTGPDYRFDRVNATIALDDGDLSAAPLDIRGEAFDTAFVVKGEIRNVVKLTGLALDVDVSGPDLAPISRFTGVDLPPNLAFTAAGKVSGGGDRYAVAGLKLALGNTDAGGDITISLAGARPRIEGTIRATRIDLTELDLPPAAGAPKTTAATAPGASGDKPSERAFSDTGLPLDVLKAFDAKLAISIAELTGPDYRFDRVNATIALDDGDLSAAPLDIRGEAFDTAFVVKGEIGNVAKLTGLALDIDVSGPDLSPFSRFTGVDLPPNLAFTAAGKVSGGGDRYAVAGLKLALGNTDAGGDIAISLAGVRPRIEGTIRATRIDLTELDLPPAAGALKTTTAATAPGASGGEPSGRVFSGTALPLDALKAFDAELAISIAELTGPDYRFDRVDANIALDDGDLTIDPLGFSLSGSAVKGAVRIAENTNLATVEVKLASPDLNVGEIIRDHLDIDLLRGSGAVDIDIRGNGNSLAAIMASLNGYSRVIMEKGEARTAEIETIVGGLSSVLKSFVQSKKEWTVVNCLASEFKFSDGIATSQVMLVDGEFMTLAGSGQIDLGNETLALKVTPAPKAVTISGVVPVGIGGTIANPTFAPEAIGTISKIGRLFGYFLFPPSAVTALADMADSDNRCIEIAQGGAAK